MFKLIKYEIKGHYKILLGLAAALFLLNAYLFIRFSYIENTISGNDMGVTFIFSFLGGFAAIIAVVIMGINLLRRDMFGDTGYLLFSLPKRGYEILGSKLITAFIEFFAFFLLTGIFVFIQVLKVVPIAHTEIYNQIGQNISGIFYVLIMSIFAFFSFMLVVYFSIAAARSILGNRRFGKTATFGVFIGFSLLTGWIGDLLQKVFPQTIDLKNFLFSTLKMQVASAPLNIASSVFNLLVLVALFFVTSYILEHKAEI